MLVKTYIEDQADHFCVWLIHKLERIAEIEVYYRSDDRNDLESLFVPAYPLRILAGKRLSVGRYDPDTQAEFILEEVGNRLMVVFNIDPVLEHCFYNLLRFMVDGFPDTSKDLQPHIDRIANEYGIKRDAPTVDSSSQVLDIEPRIAAFTPDIRIKIDEACEGWVNRGYLPHINMSDYLKEFHDESGIFLTIDQFKAALRDAGKRGLIKKSGKRWKLAP